MPIPLLPRLNEDKKVAITKRGEWKSEMQNTLSNLVKDLKVTANADSDITSIPDLWARPAMYKIALFDKKHHLHKKYVSQWRGILAMLAFREMRGFKSLKKEEIIIPDASKIADNEPSFLKVVASLLPEEYKKDEYKDETVDNGCYKLQLLTYSDAPLAIIWPTILLCPAVGLDNIMDRTVSWWNIDGISDPVASLNDQEKGLLSQWIEGVIEQLPATNDKLMDLLSTFKDDLAVSERTSNYGLGIGLGITGFCKCIDRDIKCEIDSSQFLQTSNVKLINRRGTNAKTLLVLTADMYKQWNKSASDIIVAGNFNLDSVLPYGGVIFNKSKLNDIDLSEFNAELRMGDEFFTDKICLIEGDDTLFPNSLYKKQLVYKRTKNVLLPLKQELLQYLTPDYIVKNIRISTVNNVDIKVELDLPVQGFDSNGAILTVQKVYKGNVNNDDSKNEIIEKLALPLIQIWPNFIPSNEENWQAYYSYYDDIADPSAFLAEPLWNEDEIVRKLSYKGDYNVEIRKGRYFPEGYVCTTVVNTSASSKIVEIGLILLARPDKLQLEINNNCKIGVDFGTTNTVAYMSMNDKEPQLMHFQDRLYQVTSSNDMYCKAELRRHFMPSNEQPNSGIKSIRTLFNPNIGEFDGELKQAVFPGVIYYLDGIDNIGKDENFTNLIQGKEMKWDSQGIDFMTYFLLDMGIQCLAEAVAQGATHIEWYYSYPGEAFDNTKIEGLKNIWLQNIKFLQTIAPNMIAEKPIGKVESLSMAMYFKKEMGAAIGSRGIACFDIGGGSTDIAIWKGREGDSPKGQCSIKFAGNDILNQQLFKHKEILKNNFSSNAVDFNKIIEELSTESDYDKFNIKLEALLKYHENKLFKSFVSRTANDDFKLFIRDIAFSLAGIFFYAGIIIGDLKKKQTIEEDLPYCYIGGNGSKLLDWVANGDYSNSLMFQQVYTMCLIGGILTKTSISKDHMLFDIKKSNAPKEEVAYGLVCEASSIAATKHQGNIDIEDTLDFDSLLEDIDEEEKKLAAGEAIYVNGELLENAFITKSDIKAGVKVDSSLPQFTRFLSLFNKMLSKQGYSTEHQINLSKRQLAEIRDQANEEFAQFMGVDEAKITLEAPFIVLLRNALKYIS